jgi:hypothetical protein
MLQRRQRGAVFMLDIGDSTRHDYATFGTRAGHTQTCKDGHMPPQRTANHARGSSEVGNLSVFVSRAPGLMPKRATLQ